MTLLLADDPDTLMDLLKWAWESTAVVRLQLERADSCCSRANYQFDRAVVRSSLTLQAGRTTTYQGESSAWTRVSPMAGMRHKLARR